MESITRDYSAILEPRLGTRCFDATTNVFGVWTLSRVGLSLEEAIDEELADYRRGREAAAGRGIDAYAARQDDRAIWEGNKLLAVIRPRVGGEPEVTVFDPGFLPKE